MNLPEAIAKAFQLFDGAYQKKWSPNGNSAVAWTVVLDGQDPNEVLATSVKWIRDGNEWPPSPADILKNMGSRCRCGECLACKRKTAKQIMERGGAKRLYGSGGAFLPPPAWADAAPRKATQQLQAHEEDHE
jgi:hypothetical protein